jgi:hypothetical protein
MEVKKKLVRENAVDTRSIGIIITPIAKRIKQNLFNMKYVHRNLRLSVSYSKNKKSIKEIRNKNIEMETMLVVLLKGHN